MYINITSLFPDITSENAVDIISLNITTISFLIGTASFILGFYYAKMTPDPYQKPLIMLTLTLTIPCAGLVAYGVAIIVSFPNYSSYLPAFVTIIIPIITIFYLLLKSRRASSSDLRGK